MSTDSSGEFYFVFKHFQGLENLILNILKEKTAYLLTYNLLEQYSANSHNLKPL